MDYNLQYQVEFPNTNHSLYLSQDYQTRRLITEDDNLPKSIRTSHNLAYSTRPPKPPGYNLK